MDETKYVRTENNSIIIFGATIKHSKFKHLNPVSAGFVYFYIDEDETLRSNCYGRSESLDLNPADEDEWLIDKQILGN